MIKLQLKEKTSTRNKTIQAQTGDRIMNQLQMGNSTTQRKKEQVLLITQTRKMTGQIETESMTKSLIKRIAQVK